MAEIYHLFRWVFVPKGDGHRRPSVTVPAAFDMTEAEARAAAARRGVDVTGWEAKCFKDPVAVEATAEPGKRNRYRATVRREQTVEVEVEASDEKSAREAALEEAGNCCEFDWDTEDSHVDCLDLIEQDVNGEDSEVDA